MIITAVTQKIRRHLRCYRDAFFDFTPKYRFCQEYFNIVRKQKFEDTMFMAVYSLWQNNGLDKMRIPSDK